MSKAKKEELPLRANDTEVLTMQLAKLLGNNQKKDQKISIFLISINHQDAYNTSLDSLNILTTSFHKANSTDSSNFIFII